MKLASVILIILSFSTQLHAENQIKYSENKSEPLIMPKSTKIINCSKDYGKHNIINSSHCEINKNYHDRK